MRPAHPNSDSGAITLVDDDGPPTPPKTRSWWPIVMVASIVAIVMAVAAGANEPSSPVPVTLGDLGPVVLQSNDVSVFEGITDRMVLIRPQVGFTESSGEMTVVTDGRTANRQFASDVFPQLGQADVPAGRLVRMFDTEIVFLSMGQLMVVDAALSEEFETIAEAVYLLPGSQSDHLWAVGSGSRTVHDIAVSARTVESYDLAAVGIPLDSYAGGLVVAPADRSLGRLATWSPDGGSTAVQISEEARFAGAASNRLVLVSPGRLETFDTDTGAYRGVAAPVGDVGTVLYDVAPDGLHLAVVTLRSAVELPLVRVIDTRTGDIVHEVDNAVAWQLQWMNDRELLFLRPRQGAYQVVAQDVLTGNQRVMVGLPDPSYRIAVGE